MLGFDGTAAILRERDQGRVSKLPRGAGLPSPTKLIPTLAPLGSLGFLPRSRSLLQTKMAETHRSLPVSRIPGKNRGSVNSLVLVG